MSLNAKELDVLGRGGLLHDIGKIAVPTALLNKQGPLTEEEFAVMKEHPRTGARILAVADVYAALTSKRPYRAALSHEKAASMIAVNRGTQFDPRVVDVFLTMIKGTAAA
jgi:HD-GYP domain-containing protein (c-di-GMP phosphodiesterase class II)